MTFEQHWPRGFRGEVVRNSQHFSIRMYRAYTKFVTSRLIRVYFAITFFDFSMAPLTLSGSSIKVAWVGVKGRKPTSYNRVKKTRF